VARLLRALPTRWCAARAEAGAAAEPAVRQTLQTDVGRRCTSAASVRSPLAAVAAAWQRIATEFYHTSYWAHISNKMLKITPNIENLP